MNEEQNTVGEENRDLRWGWRSFRPQSLQWLNCSVGLLITLASCGIVYGKERFQKQLVLYIYIIYLLFSPLTLLKNSGHLANLAHLNKDILFCRYDSEWF